MNYKNIFKRETKVFAYIVICMTLVVIGASYAMFLQVNKNTTNQVVETGTLVITYKNGNGQVIGDDGTNNTAITSSACLDPMGDDDASILNECAYKLNILNTGTLPASYRLVIYNNTAELPSGKTFVDHSLIRVGIKRGTTTLEQVGNYNLNELPHTSDTSTETAQNNIKYVIAEGTLEAGSDITYSVQTWLNEDKVTSAVSGQYVYLKLEVTGVVSENAPLTTDTNSGGVKGA